MPLMLPPTLTPGERVLIDSYCSDPGFDVGVVAISMMHYTNVDIPHQHGGAYHVRMPTLALTPIHGPPMRDGRWYSGRGTASTEVGHG